MDKVALRERFFSEAFCFPLSVLFHRYTTVTYVAHRLEQGCPNYGPRVGCDPPYAFILLANVVTNVLKTREFYKY
jgi:hypothetical protein